MAQAYEVVTHGLLVPVVARSFLAFGVLAVAVGIGLIVDAARMRRIFTITNRWISTRLFFQRVEATHDIDPLLTRNRYLFGGFVAIGALYALFGLIAVFDLGSLLEFARDHARHRVIIWGIQMLWWVLVFGNLLALVVGLLELVAPARLERISRFANRWVTPVKVNDRADEMNMALDNWVERFPRFSGLVITAGALVVVAEFALMLSRH